MSDTSDFVIQEGKHVVVKRGDSMKIFQVYKKRDVYLGKSKFNFDSAIGSPYGSAFKLEKTKLVKIENPSDLDDSHSFSNGSKSEVTNDDLKDNRHLCDDNSSQKMTREEIESLKGQGISANEIIGQLIENSSTFNEKTEYSKNKYLKKKKDKYIQTVWLYKPTTRLIVEQCYQHSPIKIMQMRIDTLSQILSIGDVRSGGKYMVVDCCQGLLAGSMLERLGGEGEIVHIFVDHFQQLPMVKFYDFPPDVSSCLSHVKLDEFLRIGNGTDSLQFDKEGENTRKRVLKDVVQEAIRNRKFDGLIVASQLDPTKLTLELTGFLANSRSFCVYSQYSEPLVDCYTALRQQGESVFLKLSETWLRKHQIVPDRTHPMIQMSGASGYILSGIKVERNLIQNKEKVSQDIAVV